MIRLRQPHISLWSINKATQNNILDDLPSIENKKKQIPAREQHESGWLFTLPVPPRNNRALRDESLTRGQSSKGEKHFLSLSLTLRNERGKERERNASQ